jgi:hypothetical protein
MRIVCGFALAGSQAGVFCAFKSAVRNWRMPLGLLAVVVVAGCAPTRAGLDLDAMTKTIGAPKGGQSRVIVIRDKAYAGIFDEGWQAYLDGIPMGNLKTGMFVYKDRPAGQHQLFFGRPGDLSRGSQQEFATAPARTYFFRLQVNQKGAMVSAAAQTAGLAGLLVSSAISAAADERGLFDFVPLDEATAQQAMVDLRLAE